jgi:hypothetical protein
VLRLAGTNSIIQALREKDRTFRKISHNGHHDETVEHAESPFVVHRNSVECDEYQTEAKGLR